MDAWIDIRRKARACHQMALVTAKGDRCAVSLTKAALKDEDLELRYVEFGPGTLGSLDRSARLVNVAKDQDPMDELLVIVHEIGHFILHNDPNDEVTGLQHGLGGDAVDNGASKVEGYSPRERKEFKRMYLPENFSVLQTGFAKLTSLMVSVHKRLRPSSVCL